MILLRDNCRDIENVVEDKYLLAKQNEIPSHFLKQFHLPKVGMSCKQGLVRFYSVPGAFPRPDDQGYSLFCSRFALAKAICNGRNRENYTGRVSFKDTKPKIMGPDVGSQKTPF